MLYPSVSLSLRALLRRVGVLSALVLLEGVLASDARADFVAPYAFTNFTLTNSAFANGTAASIDDGRSIVLTGPNDGSGLAGFTELSVITPAAGTLHFKYSYASLDVANADTAGYVLNGVYFPLATMSGQSGAVDVTVRRGDTFGFRVESIDNVGEPGVLTISDFVPPEPKHVPTASFAAEATLAVLLGILSLGLRRRAFE